MRNRAVRHVASAACICKLLTCVRLDVGRQIVWTPATKRDDVCPLVTMVDCLPQN